MFTGEQGCDRVPGSGGVEELLNGLLLRLVQCRYALSPQSFRHLRHTQGNRRPSASGTNMVTVTCMFPAYLDLTNDVRQPFTARVLTLHRLVRHAVSNDAENLGQVGVVWSEHDGVVAVREQGTESVGEMG